MTPVELHSRQTHILYDAEIFSNPDDISFNSQDWAHRSAIIGFAEGRGTTFFVQHQSRDFVLRHYQRGGMVADLLGDRYIYTGLKRTRPWREWKLLVYMHARGLPVPLPAAVKVTRDKLLYSADIMMHRIPHARSVLKILEAESLSEGYWIAIGSLIRRFHEAGIYHADLNANNILLDNGGRFYLIDFDRGRIRRPHRHWQKENLQRLKRSLEKSKSKQADYHFNDQNWHSLLRGYGWTDITEQQ